MAASKSHFRNRLCRLIVIVAGLVGGTAVASEVGHAEYRFERLGGGETRLAEHRGQWLVVNYWATWCAPCRQEMPELDRLHRSRDDVTVLGLTVGKAGDPALATFVRLVGIGYPVLLVDESKPPPPPIGVPEVYPTTYVLDPRGRLVEQFRGPVHAELLASTIDGAGEHQQALPEGNCAVPKPFTDLSHCSFAGLLHESLDLRGARLDGVDFANARIAGCNLSGASLRHADLKWADLGGCTLIGTDFSGSDLFHTTFDGGVLDDSQFIDANLFGANMNEVHATGADFSRAYMKDIAMEHGDFSGSRFSGCFMLRAVAMGSTLREVDFTEATLTGGAFEEADLSAAVLSHALLNGARMDDAVLRGAELEGSRFVNAVLGGADFTDARNAPEHLEQMLKGQ